MGGHSGLDSSQIASQSKEIKEEGCFLEMIYFGSSDASSNSEYSEGKRGETRKKKAAENGRADLGPAQRTAPEGAPTIQVRRPFSKKIISLN